MTMPVLRRCRSVSGSQEKRAELPEVGFAEDAIYLPEDDFGLWGLFSEDERIYYKGRGVPEALSDGTYEKLEFAPSGTYLYVGLFVLHYGHFLIETLSHFWPLLSTHGDRPKILCHRLKTRPEGPEHDSLYEVLAGLGIRRDDVISFDQPVRVANVMFAEASFRERSYVHSVFGDLCRRIGEKYQKNEDVDIDKRPLYLSKSKLSSGISRLINESAVEAELDRLGVEIAYPEALTFADQIRLLSSHKYIMGLSSSACHTAAFAAPGRRIITLNWSPEINANHLLFDQLNQTVSAHYCAVKTIYSEVEGFGVGWLVPDPENVAREMLKRVECFDRLDDLDALDEAMLAKRAHRPTEQLRQWGQVIADRLGRAFGGPR